MFRFKKKKHNKPNKPNQDIVVGKGYRQVNKRKILIVLTLVIVIAGVAGYLVFRFAINDSEDNPPSVQNANVKFAQDDSTGVMAEYDRLINDAKDPETKKSYYAQKSLTVFNMGLIDEALEAAFKANDLGPDEETTSLLATIYQEKGDKDKAIEYYLKAAEYAPESRYIGNTKQGYMEMAKNLGWQE